ncbi:MAG: extracellular solute-binding protein, partial [Actinomycetia bacterium]|nr:extracellular solute-binding protein [Actinomycetes bacterium]
VLAPAFQADTGIRVKTVSGATGDLYARIRDEAASPSGDVMFGGDVSQALAQATLWEPYVAADDAAMTSLGRNVGGVATPFQADGSVLLVNADRGRGLRIEGYADLLNPVLKGRIALGDPATSSAAFAQVTTMVAAMGTPASTGFGSDAGWDYVQQLLPQGGGAVAASPAEVAFNVVNGTDTVGLVSESRAQSQLLVGLPVKIVYPREGTVFLPACAQIIKGAPHAEQARAFLDWIQSEPAQRLIADATSARPVRAGIVREKTPALGLITTLPEDIALVAANRDAILARYRDALSAAG